jgi:transposase
MMHLIEELVKPTMWERHGPKPWIEAAKKRHHNVLAIALANKLARIALAVLNRERDFECSPTNAIESSRRCEHW